MARAKKPKDWIAPFLDALAQNANVSAAAKTAGVGRWAVYERRRTDPEFAEQWRQALDVGIGALEDVAIERARKYSDTLLIFLLKSHRPAVYNQPIRHAGGDGGPLQFNIRWANTQDDDDSDR